MRIARFVEPQDFGHIAWAGKQHWKRKSLFTLVEAILQNKIKTEIGWQICDIHSCARYYNICLLESIFDK